MNNLLDTLVFKPGQKKGEEDTTIIPLLEKLNILHAISIGPAAKNMAQSYEQSPDILYKREESFLAKNKLSSLKNGAISIVPDPGNPKIRTISSQDLINVKNGTKIQADCLFTTTQGLLLVHKPADCPTAIIKAVGEGGKNILGLVHLGRPQVNQQITERVLEYLFTKYACNPTDIFIGISPSIGPQYYWIKQKDHALIDRDYWGYFAKDDNINGENIIRIDVLEKILAILADYKIPNTNIQAYGHADAVDTYALAAGNPPQAFSHRYATSTNQPHRNGRIMVAAQLPNT